MDKQKSICNVYLKKNACVLRKDFKYTSESIGKRFFRFIKIIFIIERTRQSSIKRDMRKRKIFVLDLW